MSEKAENVQRKTFKGLQKAGELLLETTLKHYRKVWLFGRKQRSERWLKAFVQRY